MKMEGKRNKARLKETVNPYKTLAGKYEGKISLGRPYFMCTW
jgi:hypothetical protein